MRVPDQSPIPPVDETTEPPSTPDDTSGELATAAEPPAVNLGYVGLPASGPLSRALSALKHRNYSLLFFGAVAANIGWNMREATLNWLVIDLSGSEGLLGTNALAIGLAMLFVLPVGGSLADHVDRRWLIGLCFTIGSVATLCLAALALNDQLRVWHLICLSGLIGLLNGVRFPAQNSLVVSLVSRERITSAVALLSIQFQVARIIGPLLAGFVFLAFAHKLPFSAACNFALFSVGTLIYITALIRLRDVPTVTGTDGSMIRGIRDGIGHLRRRPDLAYLYMLMMIAAVLTVSFATLVPAYVKKILVLGADRYTFAMSCAGVGAVIGAIIQASRGNTRSSPRFVYIVVMISATFVTVAGFWAHYLVLIVVAFVSGMSFMSLLVAVKSNMMTTTPDHLRGRMSSHLSLSMHLSGPLGAFATGLVAERFDVMIAYRALGVAVLLSLLALVLAARRFRA